jgi:hypothetical protein
VPAANSRLEQLRRLAWLLDSSIPIPGTRLSIGLEALIGLIPGLGDLIGVVLSSYILREAHAMGVSRGVLARMALNVAIEGVAGSVPVAGDIFDAAWKANQRNVRLLNAWLERPEREARAGRAFLTLLLAGVILLLAVCAALAWLLLVWLASLLT